MPGLAQAGFRLQLTVLAPFPDESPDEVEFVAADLTDLQALTTTCPDDVTDIIHFGGINTELSSTVILDANILSPQNVFETARMRGVRVIFASSNYTMGSHPRSRALTIGDSYRPDGYFGLPKAYVELLGRMFYDKHGVENVHLRIGSCVPEPLDTRHLATWLSYPDLIRLMIAALTAPSAGYAIVWGIRRNSGRWWVSDDAERIDYFPQVDAEAYADRAMVEEGKPVSLAHQGASHCAVSYIRDETGRPL